MLKNYLLNLRPYSWVDLVLLGLVAKFAFINSPAFEPRDLYLATAMLLLWFFYNIFLELVKGYQERGTMSTLPAIASLLAATAIGYLGNSSTLVWALVSTVLVVAYLFKKRVRFFGLTNNLVRGLIQSSYFLFAASFYNTTLSQEIWLLALVILLLMFARSLVGDIRDIKHDYETKKSTLPATLGRSNAIILSVLAISAAALLSTLTLGFNWVLSLPLCLFGLAVIFSRNGYVLHQLSILTTSAFAANLIFAFSGQDLVLINLVYVGIFLNQIFYPLLSRKSNPTFVQQ